MSGGPIALIASNGASAPLTIRLLGPMQVLLQDRPLPHMRSRKARWLLALLTLRAGRPVERDWLAGTLWPDVEQGRADGNLRVVLSELRHVLGREGERLQSPGRHTLSLDLDGADVDLQAFDAAMLSKDQVALKQAVALYRGSLLEDCAEDWVWQERNIREQNCLLALQTLADAALEAGDYIAAEALQASGGTEEFRARHLDWFMAFAEVAEPHLRGAEQAMWLRRLETEHDNLRTTLSWEEREGNHSEVVSRLAGALWRFWYLHGDYSEGRKHLERVLEREGAPARTAARAKVITGAGALSYSLSDYASAQTLFQEALSLRRELEDSRGIAELLNNLGNVAHDQGDKPGIALTLGNLGNVVRGQDLVSARTLYEESLSLFRELGDRRGAEWSLRCLGDVAEHQGDSTTARALYEEGLFLSRKLGDRRGIAYSLTRLGTVSHEQGDYALTQALFEEGLGLFEELGNNRDFAWALMSLGKANHSRGDYATAQSLFQESMNLMRELGDRSGIAWLLANLGKVAYEQDNLDLARRLLAESLSLHRELRDKKGTLGSLEGLVSVMLAQAKIQKAAKLWGATSTLRESIGVPHSRIEREKYDRLLGQARAALGEDTFTSAWKEGCALTWEQATEYALEYVQG
jgi:tetratricopeptide (TPR) repeat protein